MDWTHSSENNTATEALGHIESLSIHLSLKTLVTFVSKLFFCFVPKHLGLPFFFFYKICCTKNVFFLCPELGPNFRCFTLTLGHSYTSKTWEFILKPFHKVVDITDFKFIGPFESSTNIFFISACSFYNKKKVH